MLLHRIAVVTARSVEEVHATISAEGVAKWQLYFDHYEPEAHRHAALLSNLLNAILKPKKHDMFKQSDFYPTCDQ